MAQALDPAKWWNDAATCEATWGKPCRGPFLREGAVLAVAIITDEADCSVRDYDLMGSPVFMATDPATRAPSPSSAVCWNAGVVCSGFDAATGAYSGCVSANKDITGEIGVSSDAAVLHPLSRYSGLLQGLAANREVIMLGVLGVPEVTAHADVPPHQPIEGGVQDLLYRIWRDPAFPTGDILPDEWARGVDAATKQFDFGIGPGCTGYDEDTAAYTGQAVPPVRIREVCESLNVPDDPRTDADESRVRCCIESICDDDFTPAIRCLTGLIQNVIVPVE
jgi:hypothetical protein